MNISLRLEIFYASGPSQLSKHQIIKSKCKEEIGWWLESVDLADLVLFRQYYCIWLISAGKV